MGFWRIWYYHNSKNYDGEMIPTEEEEPDTET